MQINKHTDYAFRVMLYLATQQGQRVTIQDIADVYGISKSHLMKIVNKLVNADLLHSTRGKNGGIRLSKPATDIRLHTIYIALNPRPSPINCGNPPCRVAGSCELKHIFDSAYQQLIAHMAGFTLQDCLRSNTIHILTQQTNTPKPA